MEIIFVDVFRSQYNPSVSIISDASVHKQGCQSIPSWRPCCDSDPCRYSPIVNVRALRVIWPFNPTLDVNIAHFFTCEERIVFQNHIVCVPNDATELITTGWKQINNTGTFAKFYQGIHNTCGCKTYSNIILNYFKFMCYYQLTWNSSFIANQN